ncbi:DUF2637 domain-containing protein [Streptomyces sp. NPDC048404]|uniref:DUF2637 domain-containing protein n=1 Tax=unclassified Streptomyces TaxID=2593676 RepID=UPI0034352BDF
MRAFPARVDAVIIQAVIAGALSFSHLHDLAEAAGQGGWKAWAYPVSVDLLLLAAWRRMREQQRSGLPSGASRLWFLVALVALVASLGANVATAGLLDLAHVPASLRVIVAGWPAVAFFGGTLLAHTPRTSDSVDRGASASEAGDTVAMAPTPALFEQTASGTADPDPIPALQPVDEPGPAPVPASTVHLPPALVDRAQVLARELHSSTGEPADPDTVRARLGLPASMTPAVAAHL